MKSRISRACTRCSAESWKVTFSQSNSHHNLHPEQMGGKVCKEAFGKPFHTAFLIFPGDAELLIEGVLCLNSEDDVSNYVGRMLA